MAEGFQIGAWSTVAAEARAGGNMSYSSLRAFLETTATKGRKLRHLVVERASVQAMGDKEMYSEAPEEDRELPGAVDWLNNYISGLVQALKCFNEMVGRTHNTEMYSLSNGDPYVLFMCVE